MPRLSRRSLTSSHERGLAQAALDALLEFVPVANTGHPRGEGDVVEDRERQPDRQRRHHADLAAQPEHILHRAGRPRRRPFTVPVTMAPGHVVDGAVDGLEQRGLAGLGGADDPRDSRFGGRRGLRPSRASRRAVADAQVADLDYADRASPFLPRPQLDANDDRQGVDQQHRAQQHDRGAVGSALGTSGTCVEIVNRCIDSAMHWSNRP